MPAWLKSQASQAAPAAGRLAPDAASARLLTELGSPGYATRFRILIELTTMAITAMIHNTRAFGQSSAQPAPRRMTPRAASISQVVGRNWAMTEKIHGIESTGKT